MNEIILIYPPYSSKYKSPPLGLAYLSSYLEKKGYATTIIDMDAMGISFAELKKIIEKNRPGAVGISFMTNQFGNALKVAKIAKKIYPEVPVVVGGNHVSALPEEILSYPWIDFAVLREGEITFNQLIDNLDKGLDNWEYINGLAFKRNGQIMTNKQRDLIDSLDSLPFPKWSDFPLAAYKEKILGCSEELPVFSVLTSRGCPGKCVFCSSHTVFTRRYRKRSAQNIFAELLFLEERFGGRHFNFVDDTLTIDRERVRELCALIIEGQKNYRWIANARVNTVDEDLLKLMHRAGCRNICFGVESGDPLVRQKIGKAITSEQIKNAHLWAQKAGLIVSSFFMVGNTGEDWSSIRKTISLAKELSTDHPSCSIATPFPDTSLMEEAEKNGWLISKDWDKYITSPHLDQNYSPVATNGLLSADELLEAYYAVNAAFSKKKLRTRYGKMYLLNLYFYKKEIYRRIRNQGLKSSVSLFINYLHGKLKVI